MGGPRKKFKAAPNSPAECDVSAQCDKTGPAKDMISTLPTELLDKMFNLILPHKLPIVIDPSVSSPYNDYDLPSEVKDFCSLMSVCRQFHKSAKDVFWKNVVVSVDLTHDDIVQGERKITKLRAFGVDWAPTERRKIPCSWKALEEATLTAYLRNVQAVRLSILSTSLMDNERVLNSRSVGDRDFQEHAQYFISTLRATGRLRKLVINVQTDNEYLARIQCEEDTKRFRWHLEVLELFKFCGVELKIKAESRWSEGTLKIREASLVAYIQELQGLAKELEENAPAPRKRKRRVKTKIDDMVTVKTEIEN
ncbi:hypothetical protein FKW77_001769 [Venturia effusa]|uniref:F-box domain-containing protein n=1 Tax=Venturia effusa TaxID=50376 RepID=A0A517KZ40_9PEZI|nr:hypothetical protein FKW77_001769 [Venturia effusa]